MRILLGADTPADTRAVGEAIAGLLEPGDVVALTGELGAGKTTLVQGAARALGVADPVTSPTFTLVREHRGRDLDVYHVDVFRLSRIQDVIDLGFEEMSDSGGVMFVEWGDAIEPLLPETHLLVDLSRPGPDERRRIAIAGSGAWRLRWERLERLTERWDAAS